MTMTQGGVRVLSSSNKLGSTKVIALADIHSVNDNLQDHAFDKTLKKSLEMKGMLNPILVCTDKDFKQTDIRRFERRPVPENIEQKYRCLIGNNRYKFAVENGYTHIECHLVKTFEEVKKAHLLTQIEPRRM
jgi:hypothetical protein